jgi:pimeloyl-ACP methyl ester carboxylesterase
MTHLGIGKAAIMGYSLGAGVALRTAVQYPGMVSKLVVVSIPVKREGWFPEVLAGMEQVGPGAAEAMKPSPIYELYARVASRPEDWPVLLTKVGKAIRRDYDWTKDAQAIKAPTMLVFGDTDAVRPCHIVEFFELLGGGKRDAGWDGSGMPDARLAILPGLTHYNIFSSPLLASAANLFLDAPLPGAPVITK